MSASQGSLDYLIEGTGRRETTYLFKCSMADMVEANNKEFRAFPFSSHLRQSHTLHLMVLSGRSSARKVPWSLIQLLRPLCALLCIQPSGRKDLFIQTNRRELGEVRGIRRHVDRQFFDLPGDGDAAAVQGKKPRRRRP